MTYEEMQKTMQFIVEQQAQFAVGIQQLKESQTKTEEEIGQLRGVVAIMGAETRASFEEVRGNISALVDAQMQNEENIKNLTAVVDRYFRDRNGQKDSK
jgi:predicted  nucleic acid-binding Zn-ribbon protein